MKTKKRFTLIELLVVIGVIAILMAMLLPAVSKVRVQAKKAKARAQMKALEIAIKSYETTYGLLPWGGGADVVWDDNENSNPATYDDGPAYDTLMELLTCANGPAAAIASPPNPYTYHTNTRQIRFLDAPDKFAADGFIDPWGNRFGIALDLDYNSQITVGSQNLDRSVAIWSFGPDKQDDDGRSSGSGNDDITSWSE